MCSCMIAWLTVLEHYVCSILICVWLPHEFCLVLLRCVALTSVADKYSFAVVDVWFKYIFDTLPVFLLEEFFCKNYPKGNILVLLGLVTLCKTIWSLLKLVLVQKGHVLNTMFQHVISIKRQMVLQLWLNISSIQDSLYNIRSTCYGE